MNLSLEELLKRPGAAVALDKLMAEESLREFVRVFWPWVEPARPLVQGWALDAICDHLEAVSRGEIRRLLMNVPPGFMKSLTTNVFWPAWEWGPLGMPSTRYIAASYSQSLTIRDNVRFRQIVQSDLYQMLWGSKFKISQQSVEKVANNKTGWKLATSVGGVGTGERGDRFIIDDPNSVKEAESDAVRGTTNQWFREVVPTRLNDAQFGVIVVIQQRTHDEDVSGIITKDDLDYVHLMIPMEFEPRRICTTSIGWTDPRALDEQGEIMSGEDLDEKDGELAWPERFPADVVAELKTTMGPYAIAGQFQQMPQPRGGGIFKDTWWRDWPPEDWPEHALGYTKFPDTTYRVASLDTAYTEKEENDYSALTIWGVWQYAGDKRSVPHVIVTADGQLSLDDERRPKVMLMYGWQKRLTIHGPPEPPEERIALKYCEKCDALPGANHDVRCATFLRLREKRWGLVEWVVDSCRRFQVDTLLIEAKAVGISVAQELLRLYSNEDWSVQLVNPRGDKVARAYSVVHLFSNGQVWAPKDEDGSRRKWCSDLVDQAAAFPKGAHDDLVDSMVFALQHLRETGMALRSEEADRVVEDVFRAPSRSRPLYEA